jgi:protease IV
MTTENRTGGSRIGRFFRGVWRGLDGLRRVLHLVFLLLFFGFLAGALGDSIPHVPQSAALWVAPQGRLVEQAAGDPLERAFSEASGQGRTETVVWDLTKAIDAAATDDRIKAIILETDDFSGAGQATLEELAGALQRFRDAGKKVIARGGSFTQSQYYLAAHADEIYLDPQGLLLIDGYERYRNYFKGALDKLSVDMHLFRVGEYKSAAENYTRTDMSAADREASLAYLQPLWQGYQRAVAKARGLKPGAVARYAEGFVAAVSAAKGDTATVALQAGLVTGLWTAEQVDARVDALVDTGDDVGDGDYDVVSAEEFLQVVQAESRIRKQPERHVAIVVASGEILDGDQPPGTVGGLSTARLLREAREDEDVRAVVLRVDSPGGSIVASEQIHREVLALVEGGKPVVVSMGSVAASGGYYIAAPASRIFASAQTITGSIGIFAAFPTVDRSLARLGVTTDGVGTTPLSGALRIDRPLDPQVAQFLQATLEHGYEQFLQRVGDGRGLQREAVDAVARGRVWIGSDALKHKLVDELGGLDAAVRSAATLAGLGDDYSAEHVEPEMSWAEELAARLQIRATALAGRALAGTLEPAVQRQQMLAATVGPLEIEARRLLQMAGTRGVLAWCACQVE